MNKRLHIEYYLLISPIKKINNGKREYYQKLFPSAITHEYTWEKDRLVKLRVSRSNYYTDYRFKYINDNGKGANSKNSKIVITEETYISHSQAPIYQPDVSSIKLKLTIKIKDGYMSSFVAERPYYDRNHIISKGTFSCTCNDKRQ